MITTSKLNYGHLSDDKKLSAGKHYTPMESQGHKMIQIVGTSSAAGKSTIAMAMCRYLSDIGFRVSPFKSVNMSLNSISVNGEYEIARSQWLQATAARIAPTPEINPILIKPEAGMKAQVISMGKSLGRMNYEQYGKFLENEGRGVIRNSLDRLFESNDVVIAEGAGSAAEINLYHRDLANDFVSAIYNTPIIVVSDIERGGAFASIYGVVKLMQRPDLVRWIIINKMRGDKKLLDDGILKIESLTGKKVIGVVPASEVILPGEDSLDYANEKVRSGRICVIRYPHMENYSDIDTLYVSGIGVKFIDRSNISDLDQCETIILPGSKDVEDDLKYMHLNGIDRIITKAAEGKKKIIGICGGYQMLGREITDPAGVEIYSRDIHGLGILDCKTTYGERKEVRNVIYRPDNAFIRSGEYETGYEIHYGQVSSGEDHAFLVGEEPEGSINKKGNVIGTNIHGILEHADVLSFVAGVSTRFNFKESLERNIDQFTREFRENTDLTEIISYLNK